MCNTTNKKTINPIHGVLCNRVSPLDTLAQLGTNSNSEDFELTASTTQDDKKTLLKRARRKYFSVALTLSLVDVAKNCNSDLLKSYWNTYHCCRQLSVQGNNVYANYCKNRWCMVCNSIRTAQLINGYAPVLLDWSDRYMVTLTIKSASEDDLYDLIREMQRNFSKIRERFKKSFRRGKTARLVCLRKLECTHNPITNEYHPHYHLIVKGLENAKLILKHWKGYFPIERVNEKAQDIRKCDDRSVKELFKYFTKIISKSKGRQFINSTSLHHIFTCFRGLRVFQPIGCKSLKSEENANKISIDFEDIFPEVYEWEQSVTDWVSKETGELFTGYEPTKNLKI